MGLSRKRPQKKRDTDSDVEDSDYLDNGKLMVEDEDFDDNGDEEEDVEEEEEGVDEEQEAEGDEDEEDEQNDSDEKEGADEESGGEKEEDGEDEQNKSHRDAEMAELEKQYEELRNQETQTWEILKRHKDEDLLKGQAVKNQKALWDKTLEFRFLLQRAFTSSNRLPQECVRSSFCDSNEGVSAGYTELVTSCQKTLESLLELQNALLEKNPSITSSCGNSGQFAKKQLKDSSGLDVEGDVDWLRISEMHRRISPFRDKSIDKWQRKAQVTTGAAAIKGKLLAFNQNISEQVASYMRDPSKMVKQMQQRRSAVGVFGAVPESMGNSKGEEAHADGDPELLDDSEFYQQLLKEFFETIDPASNETAFYALKRLQTKKRKIVDRRASKSRKIRYNVHEKIVNFMAPQPMNLPPMAPKLFENLFGLKTQTPATLD